MAAVPETALPTEACLTDDKKSELLAQVKQLSVDTLSIDSSFDSISRLLNNLAEAHIPKELVKDVERLTHIWHDLQTVRRLRCNAESGLIISKRLCTDLLHSSVEITRRCWRCQGCRNR